MKVQRPTYNIPILVVLLIMSIGYFFSSCTQKDINYDYDPIKVAVEFEWNDAKYADPQGMTVLFFPANSESKSWRFDISGRNGGEVELLPGDYNVLAFNNDLPGIEFSDQNDFDLFSAVARSMSDSIAFPTGILYAANSRSFRVFNHNGKRHLIRLAPDSLATVYHIRLDSVSGTERIKTASAMIKGIAKSVCLQLECNSIETCCVSAPLSIDPNCKTRLQTTTTGFGNPDIPHPTITLEIVATTSHAKYSKSFDVTDQVMNSNNPKDVYIYIQGLDIPAADSPTDPDGNPNVGIAVGVDGWQLIEIIYS